MRTTWAEAGAATKINRARIPHREHDTRPCSLQSAEWQPTVPAMERPIEVELPHKLGREEAQRRIANNIHKFKDHIPGGAAQVNSHGPATSSISTSRPWARRSTAQIDVEETKVRCRVMLPGMLAFFAKPIEAALNARATTCCSKTRTRRADAALRGRWVGPGGLLHRRGAEQGLWRAGADRHHRSLSRALRADPLRGCARPPVAEGGQQALRQGRRRRASTSSAMSRSAATFRSRNCSSFTMP